MPFPLRTLALVVVVGALATMVGGCGGDDRAAAGFCSEIREGHPAFDPRPSDETKATRALAEFDRIIAKAPAAVAPDLRTVSATITLLYKDPKKFADDLAGAKRYTEAVARVDQYLQETCGVTIPTTKK